MVIKVLLYNINNKIEKLLQYLAIASGILLLILMAITFMDVVGRYVFLAPIKGASELTEMGQSIFVITGVLIVTLSNKHIYVDILEHIIPANVKRWSQVVFGILFIVIFLFMGRRIWQIAVRSAHRNEISEYLHIPLFYSQGYVAFICIFVVVCLVVRLLAHIILRDKLDSKEY